MGAWENAKAKVAALERAKQAKEERASCAARTLIAGFLEETRSLGVHQGPLNDGGWTLARGASFAASRDTSAWRIPRVELSPSGQVTSYGKTIHATFRLNGLDQVELRAGGNNDRIILDEVLAKHLREARNESGRH